MNAQSTFDSILEFCGETYINNADSFESTGKSEIKLSEKTEGTVGIKAYGRLSRPRNGKQHVNEFVFIVGIVGKGSWKTFDNSIDAAHEFLDLVKAEEERENEKMIDFIDFENDAMCELQDKLFEARKTIMNAEFDIERTDDNDIIAEAADQAYNALVAVKNAVDGFLSKMSDYTDCNFCIEDVTDEYYFETRYFTLNWSDFDIADTFMDWLGYVLKGRENAEELSNTLYNYIAC